ncbi:hypothetical protein ACE193_15285 [Bernardetia sp. OM2101]|uniref:hypothetical protein n=1 Tax=Bernardetia sp. OM2101 TaxID=3344876 RepID=UPI0035D0E289
MNKEKEILEKTNIRTGECIEGGIFEHTKFVNCTFNGVFKAFFCDIEGCIFNGVSVKLNNCLIDNCMFVKKDYNTNFKAKFSHFTRNAGESNFSFDLEYCRLEDLNFTFQKMKSNNCKID